MVTCSHPLPIGACLHLFRIGGVLYKIISFSHNIAHFQNGCLCMFLIQLFFKTNFKFCYSCCDSVLDVFTVQVFSASLIKTLVLLSSIDFK